LFFIGGFQIGLRRVGDWIVLLVIREVAVKLGIVRSVSIARRTDRSKDHWVESTISSFSVQEVFSDPIARNRKAKKKNPDCVLIRSRLPGVLVLEKSCCLDRSFPESQHWTTPWPIAPRRREKKTRGIDSYCRFQIRSLLD
jgi:hypothetical protein